MPSTSEQRLDQLRKEASERGTVSGDGITVAGGPIPGKPGYYGEPVVRPPVWTWEIPIYFFVGALSGMSAVIATASAVFHQLPVARTALWLAAAGAIISPILLILDLGRPRLFINMLRVFKPQSAMSMGVWILTAFGASVFPALIAVEAHQAHWGGPGADTIIRVAAAVFIAGAAIFGMLLATYTGVLIGATAIPAWFLHRASLPIHFGIAGLGSAAAALELLGHRIPQLNAVGLFAAAVETVLIVRVTIARHGAADRACHEGLAGGLIYVGGGLTGPVTIVLRLLGFVPVAAVCFLLGSLASRFGWLKAGKVSGCDPEAVFASQG